MDNHQTSNTVLIPFIACSPIMIAGPTNSGKTYWVKKLLSYNMFTQPVESILYCYGVYQEMYNELYKISTDKGVKFEVHEGLPSHSQLKELNNGKFHVVVLDDLMEYIVDDKNAQALFTKYCHHYNITCVFITLNEVSLTLFFALFR